MKSFTPIIFILVGVALFFGFTDRQYKSIKQARIQEAEYSDALAKSRDLLRLRDDLQKKYNTFSSQDVDRLRKLLPDTIDNVRLIIDIDKVAAQHGLALKNIRLDDAKGKAAQGASSILSVGDATFGSVEMGFSVSADYNTFLRFLSDLEESLRIVDVTRINLQPGQKGLYTFDITLKTYWLK